MALDTYLRSAGAGASAGLRTFCAPAATLAASGNAWAWLVGALAAGELVVDKLPMTPSRLEPGGLTARIVSGGLCGAAIAKRADASPIVGALYGAATAIASAYTGHTIRRYLTQTIGWNDLPVALVEDAIAIWTAIDANNDR